MRPQPPAQLGRKIRLGVSHCQTEEPFCYVVLLGFPFGGLCVCSSFFFFFLGGGAGSLLFRLLRASSQLLLAGAPSLD